MQSDGAHSETGLDRGQSAVVKYDPRRGLMTAIRQIISSKSLTARKRPPQPPKTNVIAFSLWGDSDVYWRGATRNIALARAFYPGWSCRFYVDDAAPSSRIDALRRETVDVRPVKREHDFDGMFWRFAAAADPQVGMAMFRDCDSRIGPREAAAVEAWLRSGRDFHIMRDHPWHTTQILGGMWGCRAGSIPDLETLIARWTSFDHKGCDQEFLAASVYPLTPGRALEHSEFGLAYGNPTHPFPTQRRNCEFVGEVFDEQDCPKGSDRQVVADSLRV